jgi:hypothetical protein
MRIAASFGSDFEKVYAVKVWVVVLEHYRAAVLIAAYLGSGHGVG